MFNLPKETNSVKSRGRIKCGRPWSHEGGNEAKQHRTFACLLSALHCFITVFSQSVLLGHRRKCCALTWSQDGGIWGISSDYWRILGLGRKEGGGWEHRWLNGNYREFVLRYLSRVQLFETLWTVACQAPLSMEFSRHIYWSGLPCPPPGIFPTQGLNWCLCVYCTGMWAVSFCFFYH